MKYNKRIFIEKANIRHNNKYDYSLVNYVNSQTQIKIMCPTHGAFQQTPGMHLLRNGCPCCAIEKRKKQKTKSKKWFLSRANTIHNNKYDYSMSEYNNTSSKIKILCPTHGMFEQLPNSHLNGRGCPRCGNLKRHISITKTFAQFVDEANKIHDNKYEYLPASYVTNKIKIGVICHKHGVFKQTPNSHLCGQGCPICGVEKRIKSQTKTISWFIEEANKIHGDKYDYSRFIYVKRRVKGKIICSIHGEFEQTPDVHLDNHGCPKCGFESKGETAIRNLLTKNNIKFIPEKKFRDCKNIGELPFDFYLPIQNLLIEYDGIQHFRSIDFFGGKEGLDELRKNDEIKNNYAKENNIKLLRIKYVNLNKIEKILTNEGII